jgi:6-phosphogluconolactonase (cycloisomerase 2 family)
MMAERNLSIDPKFLNLTGSFAYLMCELVARVTVFALDAENSGLSESRTVSALADGAHARWWRVSSTQLPAMTAPSKYSPSTGQRARFLPGRIYHRAERPWSCAIDPPGRHLFAMNQASDSVAILRIYRGTGRLQPIGDLLGAMAPVCAVFVPA